MTASAFTAAQIAEACGVTKQAITERARTEGWAFTEEPGRGGKRRL